VVATPSWGEDQLTGSGVVASDPTAEAIEDNPYIAVTVRW
jgi:hypothetical protein